MASGGKQEIDSLCHSLATRINSLASIPPAGVACCVRMLACSSTWLAWLGEMVKQGKPRAVLSDCLDLPLALSPSLSTPLSLSLFSRFSRSGLSGCLSHDVLFSHSSDFPSPHVPVFCPVCRPGNVGRPLRRVAEYGGASGWKTPLDLVQPPQLQKFAHVSSGPSLR